MERRSILKGMAALPLAAVLSDARLARAAAESTTLVKIRAGNGKEIAGALAKPAGKPAPVILLVHEWWGLNDQIKATVVDFARQGYFTLGVDLFNGRVATTPQEAQPLTQKVVPAEAIDTLSSWITWASNHQDTNRRVGIVGWCFGGGWALNASVATPVDATVIYYGKCDLPPDRLERLKGPVLGHFGTRDQYVTRAMVDRFEAAMKQVGKPYTVYWYDAEHAFANPTGDSFNRPDAQLAWQRTTEFFARTLKG
jgi:carboxymethylenebutenolidase